MSTELADNSIPQGEGETHSLIRMSLEPELTAIVVTSYEGDFNEKGQYHGEGPKAYFSSASFIFSVLSKC